MSGKGRTEANTLRSQINTAAGGARDYTATLEIDWLGPRWGA